MSALMFATHLNIDDDIVEVLQCLYDHDNSINVNYVDIADNSVLHHAAMADSLKACEFIMEKFENIDLE